MLKIDVIRFEAQDVITASVARPASGTECACTADCRYDNGVIIHDKQGGCGCERFDYEPHPNARGYQ